MNPVFSNKNGENGGTKHVTNACKLCAPLGASIVFKGIKGCVPLIHGSQGCATYIRRYMISHFREPVDIASSNFSEESAIFGGNRNFITGIDNIIQQYQPEVIGIASNCLSETIGEDVENLIREYSLVRNSKELPSFVFASTPSYQGTHMDGFYEAVASTIRKFVHSPKIKKKHINILPGFVSPADIRYIKDLMEDFEHDYVLFPDYSETLDNGHWNDYMLVPSGGTSLDEIAIMSSAEATFEFGHVLNKKSENGLSEIGKETAGKYLENKYQVKNYRMGLPIGINSTDKFMKALVEVTCKLLPERYEAERSRLIDAYVDGHKYVFGKKVVLYGEEDLVLGMLGFVIEIGMEPVIVASGGNSGKLITLTRKITDNKFPDLKILQEGDFDVIDKNLKAGDADIIIGNSKGYYISRKLGIPLIRTGFPIHDRIGAQRIQHIGYAGTQQLFDRIVNALIEYKQEHSPVGYKYV
ncbi:MAG TPA: nitrogenase component 1 [Bacteroidales bacterium]|nr:nitrogenase component 1 [Bacteroidales bacterium]